MADVGPTFHVSTEDTDGEFALMETSVSEGGPAAHYHRYTTELFFVLEGTPSVRIGQKERTLGPRESALVPPKTVLSYSAPEDKQCRLLVLMSPGEFELIFREIADRRATGDFPDDIDGVEDLLEAVSDEHDIHAPPVGPR